MDTPEKNDATLLLRLPAELKATLTRAAFASSRPVTAEVNMRLRNSLTDEEAKGASTLTAGRSSPAAAAGETEGEEGQLLAAFRKLDAQRRRALITLLG